MSDFKRLLDDGSTSSDAADLLRALTPPSEPASEKQRELARQLAVGVSGAAARSGPLGSLGLKVAAGVGTALIALSALLTAKTLFAPRSAPSVVAPPQPRLVPDSHPPPAAAAASSESTPPAPTAELAAPKPSAPVRSNRAARDTLAEEEAILEQARKLSRSAPARSLNLLQQHAAQYPNGQLTAERLFLEVEVFKRLGNGAAAGAKAEVLKRRFPNSIYAKQLSH